MRKAARRSPAPRCFAACRQRVEHNNRAVLSRKDGSRCSIREVVSPILNDKGEFSGSVIVFQDFTDARTLQRQLAHAAAHDSLTGLANRASLLSTMSELIGTAAAGRCRASLPLRRSRQLQDGQRHRRTRRRRPAAQARCRDHQGERAPGRFRGAARRRRVRRHPQELRARGRRRSRPHDQRGDRQPRLRA